jgi:hypothetical protein
MSKKVCFQRNFSDIELEQMNEQFTFIYNGIIEMATGLKKFNAQLNQKIHWKSFKIQYENWLKSKYI